MGSKVSALITGVNGQDGSYLAESLIGKGVEVHGIVRRNSIPEHQESRIDALDGKLSTYYGDLLDPSSFRSLVREIQPTFVYNLAAQSHVRISFEIPDFTSQVNAIGVLNVLDAVRTESPASKVYQASSSEMFGDSVDDDGYQRETTPMHPVSPYGCAKLYGYHITRTYRSSYGLFAANGILFNHESPRRGSNFVTSKVVKAAVEIKLGLRKDLKLGNLDSYRDWGHSRDYVEAMQLILGHSEPDDFVIATGQTYSVRDMVRLAFEMVGLDYENYVSQDTKYLRPQELKYLKGDSTKSRQRLGWEPKTNFEELISEMVEHWLAKLEVRSN
jgi:GDPmannose 4,6-dehydratase